MWQSLCVFTTNPQAQAHVIFTGDEAIEVILPSFCNFLSFSQVRRFFRDSFADFFNNALRLLSFSYKPRTKDKLIK